MSKFVDHIFTIHNNPFMLFPLICEFFKTTPTKSNNILLAYLVLPLVLNEQCRTTLIKAKTTSSILSFATKNENLFGLPERLEDYKNLTNQCILQAKNMGIIAINDDLSVSVLGAVPSTSADFKDHLKASKNIHKIIKELDVVTVYRILGVKAL